MRQLLLLLYRYVHIAIFVAISAVAVVTTAAPNDATTTYSSRKNKNRNANDDVDAIHHYTAIVPSWEELDARPLPTWYDDAKFGIFIHWGIFSVPSFNGEWMWHHWKTDNDTDTIDYIQRTERYHHFTYQEYAARFQAELYQPNEWAQVFAQSGAQYVVLTSKHHDGYCTL